MVTRYQATNASVATEASRQFLGRDLPPKRTRTFHGAPHFALGGAPTDAAITTPDSVRGESCFRGSRLRQVASWAPSPDGPHHRGKPKELRVVQSRAIALELFLGDEPCLDHVAPKLIKIGFVVIRKR